MRFALLVLALLPLAAAAPLPTLSQKAVYVDADGVASWIGGADACPSPLAVRTPTDPSVGVAYSGGCAPEQGSLCVLLSGSGIHPRMRCLP